MKEVVQTSFISRKWRYIWKSVPVLNFDYSLWNDSSKLKQNVRPYVKKVYRKDECLDFVERVLLIRDRSANIQKIRLSHNYCCDSGRLNTWLVFALERHVKEVHLEIPKDGPHVLPDSLFTSTVEVFKLNPNPSQIATGSAQLPESMCLAQQLRSLELVSVLLPKGNSKGELVLNFPVLEDLILERCDHQNLKLLCLSALQLKTLVVYNFSNNMWRTTCEIIICTPNLVSIKLSNYSYKDYTVGTLSALFKANIDLQSERMVEVLKGLHNVTNLELDFSYEIKQESDMLDELLNPFLNLKCLKLKKRNGCCIQALANFSKSSPSIESLVLHIFPIKPESEHMLDELLSPFSNLRYLELIGLENGVCIQALADFLKSAPIEILDFSWKNCKYDWETKVTELSSIQYTFHNLKCVKLLNFRFDEKELKIIGFVLKNAEVLENITIFFSKDGQKFTKKELAAFSEKLHSLPKASSNVRVDVLTLR